MYCLGKTCIWHHIRLISAGKRAFGMKINALLVKRTIRKEINVLVKENVHLAPKSAQEGHHRFLGAILLLRCIKLQYFLTHYAESANMLIAVASLF